MSHRIGNGKRKGGGGGVGVERIIYSVSLQQHLLCDYLHTPNIDGGNRSTATAGVRQFFYHIDTLPNKRFDPHASLIVFTIRPFTLYRVSLFSAHMPQRVSSTRPFCLSLTPAGTSLVFSLFRPTCCRVFDPPTRLPSKSFNRLVQTE